MPTDPSDPSKPTPSTRLYQATPASSGGGGGTALFVILLLLLLGGGAAYYFFVYKPGVSSTGAGAAASPAQALATAPTATPASLAASPTPDTSGNPTYSNAQRTQYIKQADDAFLALRDTKLKPFIDSFAVLNTAGSFNVAGLTSKAAIAARRDLVSKCQTANNDMEEFYRTEDATYKAELQKTPLIPNDVNDVFDGFALKAQTDKNLKLRDIQRDSLKTGDGMLAYLDKTYGSWAINERQRLTFTKKPADLGTFSALQNTYNEQVNAIQALQKEIKDATDPNATPVPNSPAASGAPGSPAPAASAAP